MTRWRGRGTDPPRPIANAAQDFVDLTPDDGAYLAEITAAYAPLLPDTSPDVRRYWDDEEDSEWPT